MVQASFLIQDNKEHSDHPGTVCHPPTAGNHRYILLPLPRLANTVRNPPLRLAKGINFISTSQFQLCAVRRGIKSIHCLAIPRHRSDDTGRPRAGGIGDGCIKMSATQ